MDTEFHIPSYWQSMGTVSAPMPSSAFDTVIAVLDHEKKVEGYARTFPVYRPIRVLPPLADTEEDRWLTGTDMLAYRPDLTDFFVDYGSVSPSQVSAWTVKAESDLTNKRDRLRTARRHAASKRQHIADTKAAIRRLVGDNELLNKAGLCVDRPSLMVLEDDVLLALLQAAADNARKA